MKSKIDFFIKSSILYTTLSAAFSVIGIFLPTRGILGDPLTSLSIEHVVGHIVWGLAAGAASLSMKYFFVGGSFAILLDADHLINFVGIEAVPRLGHSIPFAIISAVIMTSIFYKKDYILGALAVAGVLSHLSFDTFLNAGSFPLFTPINNEFFTFQSADWIFFELAAIIIVGLSAIQTKRQHMRLSNKKDTV